MRVARPRRVHAILAFGLIALLSSTTTQSQPVLHVSMGGFDPNAIVWTSPSVPREPGVRWGSAFTEAGRNFAARLADIVCELGSQASCDFAARERAYADDDARASGLPQTFREQEASGSIFSYLGNQMVQVSPYLGIILAFVAIRKSLKSKSLRIAATTDV